MHPTSALPWLALGGKKLRPPTPPHTCSRATAATQGPALPAGLLARGTGPHRAVSSQTLEKHPLQVGGTRPLGLRMWPPSFPSTMAGQLLTKGTRARREDGRSGDPAGAYLEVDLKQLVHQEQHPPLLGVLYAGTAAGRQALNVTEERNSTHRRTSCLAAGAVTATRALTGDTEKEGLQPRVRAPVGGLSEGEEHLLLSLGQSGPEAQGS